MGRKSHEASTRDKELRTTEECWEWKEVFPGESSATDHPVPSGQLENHGLTATLYGLSNRRQSWKMVEYLPSVFEALGSTPRSYKKKYGIS